jgi:hypothetical protein
LIRGLKRLVGDLEFAGFHVDGDNSTVVTGFYLWKYSSFINLRSQASVFFLRQSRLSRGHGGPPFLDC